MKISKLIITAIILLALLSLSVPKGSCLDVSCRAIKARPSTVYNETAWGLGYTGKGVNIAVIDRGVDDEHESLERKFVAGVDVSKPLTPKDGSYNPDGCQHGTYCAGIAMGTGGDDGVYKGVAPDAKLIDVSVGDSTIITKLYIDAIEWCIDHKNSDWNNNGPDEYDGIDIITISVGFALTATQAEEVADYKEKAVNAGIVFVEAGGNAGPDNDPAHSYLWTDGTIQVGAIDDKNTVNRDDDEIADFSTRGPRVDDGDDDPYDELRPDVVAPGVDIIAPMYGTHDKYGWSEEGEGERGTSFSAPHVAGIVALMLEANADLTPEQVTQILRKTSESRGTPDSDLGYEGSDSYYNKSYGWGIVDAYEAVKAALAWTPPPEPNNPPAITIDSPGNNAKVSGIITISGIALDTDDNVLNVELKIDYNDWFNVSIVSASSLQWNYTWNTKNVENGLYTIYARAYDGKNYSTITSVNVNVYNKMSAGVEEKTKINPIYLISAAGIIGAVVIVVVCVLLFRRKKPSVEPGFPVGTGIPPPPATGVPSPVTVPPLPITGVPSVTAQCPNCGNIMEITSAKRPVKVKCPKCGAGSILR